MKSKIEDIENNISDKIPLGGTLGILAYGYRGIMMWREVRHNHAEQAARDLQKVKSAE